MVRLTKWGHLARNAPETSRGCNCSPSSHVNASTARCRSTRRPPILYVVMADGHPVPCVWHMTGGDIYRPVYVGQAMRGVITSRARKNRQSFCRSQNRVSIKVPCLASPICFSFDADWLNLYGELIASGSRRTRTAPIYF